MKYTKQIFLGLCIAFAGLSLHAQQKLPKFSFTDLEGNTFTYAQLRTDIPTLVFFFDPYCDHCQQQAAWIREAKAQLGNVQQVWVTTEEPVATQNFWDTHLGTDWDNVHVLIDKQFLFDGYFGYSEIPSIYVYNKQGMQVKSFNKETPAAVLLRFL